MIAQHNLFVEILLLILVVLNVATLIFAMRSFLESRRREKDLQGQITNLRNDLVRYNSKEAKR